MKKCLHSLAVVMYSWKFPTVTADKTEKNTDSAVIQSYVVALKANIPT